MRRLTTGAADGRGSGAEVAIVLAFALAALLLGAATADRVSSLRLFRAALRIHPTGGACATG